ncbi:hypothetical protein KO498_14020 [Lentibacter algarum]|uniref:hypothetical protein n=1 Tax=Lentibacter algarum TaxID=576131 RepID=UPI001C080FBA|nr:hypothetical protein [Lentibacter algarum]MBU2982931.1 hypothetical protein [Lentibacter algarum]
MRLFAVALLAVLAACQLVEPAGDEDGIAASTRVADQSSGSPLLLEAQCKAAGGSMVIGLAGPQCARPQPDAGKACSDSKDCAGLCLAATRTCSPVTPFFGCHEVLMAGGKKAALCVD